ncbi:UTRA domain-containing protein [Microbacterium maritypicum]|uniref:UbiC transcription regulator-associated domain-containing protein n=1 Tax=Microbacterium maritypicum TaxID=33918 RepID=A0A4Y4B5Q9_MICMQ|nr:UTRA domain-containing protein [Microbacterium liquefaciens]GEC74550.1 hypothetical protein MLI01_06950 [Microbacterium liquefaciens]GGV52449.1 hypothetical protein GCM10010213_08790 [Microbacterium liquefaciens]
MVALCQKHLRLRERLAHDAFDRAVPAGDLLAVAGEVSGVLGIVRAVRDVMLERTSYPDWIADRVAAIADDEASVVEALTRDFGVVTAFAEHAIDAVPVSSADATLLGVRRASPLLRVRRVSYASAGEPIEYGEDRYLPDAVTFLVTASRESTPLTRTEFSR